MEERGYSQDMIEDIVDYCENPNQDMHSFSTMAEALEWLNSDDDEWEILNSEENSKRN